LVQSLDNTDVNSWAWQFEDNLHNQWLNGEKEVAEGLEGGLEETHDDWLNKVAQTSDISLAGEEASDGIGDQIGSGINNSFNGIIDHVLGVGNNAIDEW